MSKLVRNIIAISVAAIAAASIVAVVVLAFITINPMEKVGWSDYNAVELYYGGESLSVSTDGALAGKGRNPDGLKIGDIFEKMNFSLFSTCLQFNYEYGLTFDDNSKIKNNEIKASELSGILAEYKESEEQKYCFVIKKPVIENIAVTDFWGRSVEIEYNTVAFSIDATKASDWPKSITAYLFVWENLEKIGGEAGANKDSYTYYTFKFSAKTAAVIDALDQIYDIDSSKSLKKEEPEEKTDGEEETDGDQEKSGEGNK